MKTYLSAFNVTILVAIASSCSKSDEIASKLETPQGGFYSLNTCVVTGERLGSMGDPVVFQHEGVEVHFCSKSCVGEFKKNPSKYLAKLKK